MHSNYHILAKAMFTMVKWCKNQIKCCEWGLHCSHWVYSLAVSQIIMPFLPRNACASGLLSCWTVLPQITGVFVIVKGFFDIKRSSLKSRLLLQRICISSFMWFVGWAYDDEQVYPWPKYFKYMNNLEFF